MHGGFVGFLYLYKNVSYSVVTFGSVLDILLHRLLEADCCNCEFCIDSLPHKTCCMYHIYSKGTSGHQLNRLKTRK